jgi:hypothetical protein
VTADFSRLAAALADRYRIERELGAGGMTTVYLAQDLKHDRQVAIKVWCRMPIGRSGAPMAGTWAFSRPGTRIGRPGSGVPTAATAPEGPGAAAMNDADIRERVRITPASA